MRYSNIINYHLRIKMRTIVILLSVNILLFSDMKVITSQQNSLLAVDKDTLSAIYLKKVTSVDNKHITPIDNIADYNEFYKKVVKKTPQQVHSYWMKEIFTGKKRPPKKVLAKDLEKNLQENTTAITYSTGKIKSIQTKVIYEVK